MHIDVTHTIVVLDDGHASGVDDALDEAFAATGDDEVEILVHLREVIHAFAISEGHELHAVLRQAGLLTATLQRIRYGAVGLDGFGAAAQDRGVAGLETKRRRIAGHVRT